jgi:hypothetical protein
LPASTAAAANGWDNQNANANINHNHTVSETRNDTHNHTDNDVRNRTVNVNVQKHSNIQADERKEKNNHGVDVNLEKDLRLSTDVNFSGDPTITGDIDLDSAAIAVIDNRQSISNNATSNSLVTNSASIGDSVGAGASGQSRLQRGIRRQQRAGQRGFAVGGRCVLQLRHGRRRGVRQPGRLRQRHHELRRHQRRRRWAAMPSAARRATSA